MKQIDLNADIGEGFPFDQNLIEIVSSANIACGLHAGNAIEMRNAVVFGKKMEVRIGAHPSFPDRENFGRKIMNISSEELKAYLFYQLGALKGICQAENVALSYVKPHGALYNQAACDPQLALTIAQAVYHFDPHLKLMGLAGSLMLQIAEQQGLQTISEVFADRRYMPDGSLVPRSKPYAIIEDEQESIVQVLQMIQQGKVKAIDGSLVSVKVESLCLHGDNAKALKFAQAIKQQLQQHKIKIQS